MAPLQPAGPTRKEPAIAVLLSIAWWGLGHWYGEDWKSPSGKTIALLVADGVAFLLCILFFPLIILGLIACIFVCLDAYNETKSRNTRLGFD